MSFSLGRVLPLTVLLSSLSTFSLAQNTDPKPQPVLDVHVHAMDDIPGAGPMCPNTAKFTASDPKTKEAPFGWVKEECTPKLYPSAGASRRLHERRAGRDGAA